MLTDLNRGDACLVRFLALCYLVHYPPTCYLKGGSFPVTGYASDPECISAWFEYGVQIQRPLVISSAASETRQTR